MEVLILNGTPLNSRDYIMSVHRGVRFKRFHTYTNASHSLWSLREVVVKEGFNFEWNTSELLRLDCVRS